jgi:bacterioferritin-associated ferredoxin
MVYRACGCQPQCGKCVPFVREMLREGLEGATAGQFAGAD